MKPITKILVPIDFSKFTPEVIALAADLSRRYAAPLELIHVWEPAMYAGPEGSFVLSEAEVTRIIDDFKQELTKLAASAQAAGAFGVETCLLRGYPATAIVYRAQEMKCDLILMGTHGRTGFKHVLIGSVAENVVRTAACPVLTVRPVADSA
jgi:nucleotide-binding universal stress UspA family protein